MKQFGYSYVASVYFNQELYTKRNLIKEISEMQSVNCLNCTSNAWYITLNSYFETPLFIIVSNSKYVGFVEFS